MELAPQFFTKRIVSDKVSDSRISNHYRSRPKSKADWKYCYKDIGGKAYADLLLKLLDEQKQFHNDVSAAEKKTVLQLEKLYEQATRLGKDDAKDTILQAALQQGGSIFFLKEQYRKELAAGRNDWQETHALKKTLLEKDPDNRLRVHHDVAILDFEARAQNLKNVSTADHAVQPLVDYLAHYGNRDSENGWRVELLISQVFQSKNQHAKALTYAKIARSHAPPRQRVDIAKVIIDLEQATESIGSAADQPPPQQD